MDYEEIHKIIEEDLGDLVLASLEELKSPVIRSVSGGDRILDFLVTLELAQVRERVYTAHENAQEYSLTESGRGYLSWIERRRFESSE